MTVEQFDAEIIYNGLIYLSLSNKYLKMKKYSFCKYPLSANIDEIEESVNAKLANTAQEFNSKIISTTAITINEEPYLVITIEYEKK